MWSLSNQGLSVTEPRDIGELTELLQACSEGDQAAFALLVPKVYEQLRIIARWQIGRRPRNSLGTTSLVHETYLKLAEHGNLRWRDKPHFLAAASQAMRHILVDAARRRLTQKRGGGDVPETLPEQIEAREFRAHEILSIHQVLHRLREIDSQLALVVDCRFFAGLSPEETAHALDVSERTAHRYWVRAKAWLGALLREEDPNLGPWPD